MVGLTKVSQAAAGRNFWIHPRKNPRKYKKYHGRQWANITMKDVSTGQRKKTQNKQTSA